MKRTGRGWFQDLANLVQAPGKTIKDICPVVRIPIKKKKKQKGGRCLGPGEVRIRVPSFCAVDFSRRTLPQERVKGHHWGT